MLSFYSSVAANIHVALLVDVEGKLGPSLSNVGVSAKKSISGIQKILW
jgi:hypothetical protein